MIAHASLSREYLITLTLRRGAIALARVATSGLVTPPPKKDKEKPALRPALPILLSYQPLVTIGGGAFGDLGDLPAHAARLRIARVAMTATATFFMGSPSVRSTKPQSMANRAASASAEKPHQCRIQRQIPF
jgi:hypothetical protein